MFKGVAAQQCIAWSLQREACSLYLLLPLAFQL
jgi:hypothetical protein